jgi:hypothetical protein
MAGPETIDLSGATYQGPGARKEKAENVNIGQGQTSIQRGQADLEYIGPTAKEQLDRIILQNEQLQRDLEKAKKGEPLAGDDKTRLVTDVDAYDKLMRAIQKFDPDYVGTVFDFPGEIESAIQKRVYSGFGTPGQSDFWSEMRFLDMLTRNKYFGASLSGNEKASYAETTITPGVTAETALANLKRRAETVRTGIQRNVRSLMEGGYRPAQINAQLGNYLPELNPRWLPASSERVLADYASSEDYDPTVYQKMLLDFGDANGVRLEPAAAEASANAVADMRAKGQTSFGGAAVYQGLEKPEDEAAAAGAAGADGGGGGGDDGEGLGWAETLGSALVNLPRSTADELGGIWDAVTNPIQTAKSVGSLGGALLSKMGVADFDESSADALGQYYVNKYGSLEGFKKELANNPASILADVATVLTGGAGVATKLGLPAKIATLGNKAALAQKFAGAVARNVDPITAMTNLVTKAAPAAVKVAGKGAGKVATTALGLSTGAGGDAITEAAKVGFNRGAAGAPTNASDAFLNAMRDPNASADEIVQLARGAVSNLRQQGSQRYLDKMAQFGKNPVPLDISNVRKRITAIKPESYDTWADSQGPRPSSHRAWETMSQFVDEYAYKATQDPSLLEPLAVDQLKQDLYDVGSKVGGAYDRDAARIASTAYDAVKDELVNHDNLYAAAMKDYENAVTQAQQLEGTFGLSAARGKQPNIESAGRKLAQSLRNNVNTNFGTRRAQVDALAGLDPSGRLLPSLAGQALNAWEPRGLQRGVAGGFASSGLAGIGLDMIPMAMDVPGYLTGTNLAALPLMSPRTVGEAAYYGGQAAGTANRVLEPVTSRFGNTIDKVAELQSKYRDPLVYAGFGAQNIGAMQEEPTVIEEDGEFLVLSDGTKVRMPAAAPAAAAPTTAATAAAVPVEGPVMMNNRPTEMREDGRRYYVGTDEFADAEETYPGDPARGMYRGGAVQRFKNGGQPSFADRARSVAKGATFAFNDEMEAGLRALAQLDPAAYQREVQKIRAQQAAYEKNSPLESLAYEMGGSMLPALVPGGQVATAGRMASLAARAPRTAMAVRRAAPVAGSAALYGAGAADSMRDIPRSMAEEAAFGLGMYGAGNLAARPAKAGYRKVRSIFR